MSSSPKNDLLTADYIAQQRLFFKGALQQFNHALAATDGESARWQEPLTYLYAFHWLHNHLPSAYRQRVATPVAAKAQEYPVRLFLSSPDESALLTDYFHYWAHRAGEDPRSMVARSDAASHYAALVQQVLAQWHRLENRPARGQGQHEQIRLLGQEQKEKWAAMSGAAEQERLALVDELPDPAPGADHFTKVGLVPTLACPQSCRHCLFIYRPTLRKVPSPEPLFRLCERMSPNILFTGGDLTGHLDDFCRAIREMKSVQSLAILLNGAFAVTPAVAMQTMRAMDQAMTARGGPVAVTLQISCDEFHQEIMPDRHGQLRERIPVAHLANLLQAASSFPRLRISLIHKQNSLNFSMALFQQGVLGRLARCLAERGDRLQVLQAHPSPRKKEDPTKPGHYGPVLREALLALASHPAQPIHWVSSVVDAMGRAALLEPGEVVTERSYLQDYLTHGVPPEERFDTDPMFWYDGKMTLFAAAHYPLGNLYEEGEDRVLERWRKDPLRRALDCFDRRLPEFYRQAGGAWPSLLARATSPHHILHLMTEEATMRLALTRCLLKADGR